MTDRGTDAWLDEHDTELVDDVRVVNGADRAWDGTFAMLPDRRFDADGRTTRDRALWGELVEKVCAVAREGPTANPFEALEGVAELRRLVDRIECEVVCCARSWRWTWRDIADAMGLSAGAVHRRFAQVDVNYRRRPNRPFL